MDYGCGQMMVAGSGSASAAAIVVSTAPPDDAGAATADRYDWQAIMAAADGLALYLSALDENGQPDFSRNAQIICERHEDWVVIDGGAAELVSAKHREPSVGAFTTLAALASLGGLKHMFDRWKALQEKPTCRLVTTAGLAAGPAQNLQKLAKTLQEARVATGSAQLSNETITAVEQFAKELGAADNVEQVTRFLSMLTISSGAPTRSYVAYAAPSMYAKPILDRIGSSTPPEALWEAMIGLFRSRMRAAGELPTGGLPTVLAGHSTSSDSLSPPEPDLLTRTVTLTEINVAVNVAKDHAAGYLQLPKLVRTSRMAVKMAAGACHDNSIERAEALRLAYRRYWRDRSGADPTSVRDRTRLDHTLLSVTDACTTSMADEESPWGLKLWLELQQQLSSMVGGDGVPSEFNVDFLLGGVCDLTNRCKVWFGDSFDIDAAMELSSRERGGRRA